MRLIDADAIQWTDLNADMPKSKVRVFVAFKDRVDRMPTIDAVEVVRCKECKYWQDNNDGYPHKECRWGKDETPDAEDFCSYGERGGKSDEDL